MPFENDLKVGSDAIIVALGSNLSGAYGSVEALLEAALAAFPDEGLTVVRHSRWWRSAAWPDANDPPFLNGVALIETRLSPTGTLAALHRVEARFGRERHVVNAPRTLDLDLIAYGQVVSKHPSLPHPRAHERRFVMGPLAEIAPGWREPVRGESAEHLADKAKVGTDARPL